MADPTLSLFTAALQQAQAINEAAKTAHANKVSCMAMNHRIQIANEIIKAAHERQKANPKTQVFAIQAFRTYVALLERMRDFVLEISKRKTFSKLFYALRYRDEFDALLRDFDNCVLELNLGIALRTQAQLETDRNALEEDMVELKDFRKDLQNGLDSLGGQLVGIRQMIATNRPMDDILAQVEVDYNQVVSITPGESRQGRTFPVHKRSWLSQEVAEKPLGYFGSQDMLDMLKSEVAILKKLDRCNYITKFMGVTNKNNQISIIMEWLPNGDLATYLAKDKMDWEQKLFIAADIARGLQFLHEVGIIHKTLRAKNILLTRFNQAKITNFRQSRLDTAQTRPMSDPFSFVRWLAPEKMTHKEVRYGAECDIYSFGMLLFEIASNKIPFLGRSDRELPELIVLKDFYETVPAGTPTEFANIMSACWSHDPRLRPTVSQVLLILRDACVKFENGQQNFGGLPSSLKEPAPLFAILPPEESDVYPISPPMTPIGSANGLLTPDVWNNPYVNKRYVEESLEELRQSQQQIGQLAPTPMPSHSQPQPQPQPQTQPQPQPQPQPVQPLRPQKPQSQPQPQRVLQPQHQSPLQPQTQPTQIQRPLQPQPQPQPQSQTQPQTQPQRLGSSLAVSTTDVSPMKAQSLQTPPIQFPQQYPANPPPATVSGLQIRSPRAQQAQQQPMSPVQFRSINDSKQEYSEHEHGAESVITPRQLLPQPQPQQSLPLSSAGGPAPRPVSIAHPIMHNQASSPGLTAAPIPPASVSGNSHQGSLGSPPLVNRDTRPGIKHNKRINQPLEVNMNRLSLQEGRTSASPPSTQRPTMHDRESSSSSSSSSLSTPGSAGHSFNTGGYNNMGPLSPPVAFSSSSSHQSIQSVFGAPSYPRPAAAQGHSSTNLLVGRPVSPNPHNNPNTMSRALRLHESQERDKAWVIFKMFNDQGNVEGMYWTAYYLFHGEGGQAQDRQRAFEIFLVVTRMDLLMQSPTTAFEAMTQHQQMQQLHFQRLASNAHFYTAVCYLEGQGTERNHLTGFGHMEMAADSGNAFAQYLVGDAYHKGSAVVQANMMRRNHYWQLAARQREQRAIDQCRKFGIPI